MSAQVWSDFMSDFMALPIMLTAQQAADVLGIRRTLAHDRIVPDTFEHHLERIAAVQADGIRDGQLTTADTVGIGGGERAHAGDIVATRRNDRQLTTDDGDAIRNRELWTVTQVHASGSLTIRRPTGHGTVTLPADYVTEHVRLGYAATEHANQSDTVTTGTQLVTAATRRGLYVVATRGRTNNLMLVITDEPDVDEARDVLERVLATDPVDIPATTQR